MKELEIFDKVENNEYLISLGELIKKLEQIDPDLVKGEWEIKIGAYGYGEFICSIEDYLKSGKRYFVDADRIFSVLKAGKEYFYHAYIKKVGEDIEIGIHDSSFLFVRTRNDELMQRIKGFFKEVLIINR